MEESKSLPEDASSLCNVGKTSDTEADELPDSMKTEFPCVRSVPFTGLNQKYIQ